MQTPLVSLSKSKKLYTHLSSSTSETIESIFTTWRRTKRPASFEGSSKKKNPQSFPKKTTVLFWWGLGFLKQDEDLAFWCFCFCLCFLSFNCALTCREYSKMVQLGLIVQSEGRSVIEIDKIARGALARLI